MFQAQFHDPRIARLQGRLARVPRWAWIVVFVGVLLIPVVVLGFAIVAVGLVTVAIVMAAAMLVVLMLGVASYTA